MSEPTSPMLSLLLSGSHVLLWARQALSHEDVSVALKLLKSAKISVISWSFHLLNHLIKNESKSETNQGSYDLELLQSIISCGHATL